MNKVTASYDFSGKIVLVTGGSAGIGKSIATRFHESGATVIIADIRQKEGEEFANSLGDRMHYGYCDISVQSNVEGCLEMVTSKFGRLDIMINNAGINATDKKDRVTVDQYSANTWQKIVDIDLSGTFYCCSAAAAIMRKQGNGAIVNIASIAGVVALRLQAGFVAAKAAVLKLTEAMACELAPLGIRVNAVSPGSIITDTTKALFYSEQGSFNENAQRLISFIPQQRPGNTDEVADAVIFLSSDSASYINGHNLVVDGGWTCGFNRDF